MQNESEDFIMGYTKVYAKQFLKLTEDRISKIKTLIKTERYKVVDFFNVFWNMEKSQFLKGKTDKKKITTDIDWVLVPDNFMKVLEGKYNGENDDIPYTQSPLKLSDGTYFNGRRYRCTEGMVWW